MEITNESLLLQESWYIGGNKYGNGIVKKIYNTAEMYLKQIKAILVEDEAGK